MYSFEPNPYLTRAEESAARWVQRPDGTTVWRGRIIRAMGMGVRPEPAYSGPPLLEDAFAMDLLREQDKIRGLPVVPPTPAEEREQLERRAAALGADLVDGHIMPKGYSRVARVAK